MDALVQLTVGTSRSEGIALLLAAADNWQNNGFVRMLEYHYVLTPFKKSHKLALIIHSKHERKCAQTFKHAIIDSYLRMFMCCECRKFLTRLPLNTRMLRSAVTIRSQAPSPDTRVLLLQEMLECSDITQHAHTSINTPTQTHKHEHTQTNTRACTYTPTRTHALAHSHTHTHSHTPLTTFKRLHYCTAFFAHAQRSIHDCWHAGNFEHAARWIRKRARAKANGDVRRDVCRQFETMLWK